MSKKRGRPKGATGPKKEKVAVITWKPAHDHIVLLYLAGYNNEEIASLTGYTSVRVGQLLADPRATELIAKGREKIKEKLHEDIDVKLAMLAARSVSNLEKTVVADISPLHAAKRHQDKVGLEIIQMTRGNGRNVRTSDDALPREVAERLTNALERANRVREIEAIPLVTARVVNG